MPKQKIFFFYFCISFPQLQQDEIPLQTEFIEAQQTPPPCECIRYNVGWSMMLKIKFKKIKLVMEL